MAKRSTPETPVRRIGFALILVAAASAGLLGQGLLEDVRNLIRARELAQQKLTNLARQEPKALAALEQAKKAESLARELQDREASVIARQAVDLATRTIEDNRSGQLQTRRDLAAMSIRGRTLCQQVEQQVTRDRTAVERQLRTNQASQEELQRWTQLNEQARNDALLAGVNFMLGSYSADVKRVGNSVRQLEGRLRSVTRQARNARKASTRAEHVRRMLDISHRLEQRQAALAVKSAAKYALDVQQRWDFVRNDLHHELRVAQKDQEGLRELLAEPGFKEAFNGDDLDAPGFSAISALIQEIVTQEAQLRLGLEKFERMTGPAIRAFTFMRDALFNALKSYESTQRVLQQNDLLGRIAIASGSLQRQYKNSIDALHLCRGAGYSR